MRNIDRVEYRRSRVRSRCASRLGMFLLIFIAARVFVFSAAPSNFLLAQDNEISQLESESPLPETGDPESDNGQELGLTEKQRLLSEQYALLEEALARMAEAVEDSDPERAELLRNIVQEGQNRSISFQFSDMVELLSGELYSRAGDNQDQLNADLLAILELLESENREDRLEEDRAEIEELLEDLDGVIRDQRRIHNKTLGQGSTILMPVPPLTDERNLGAAQAQRDESASKNALADGQADLAEETGELAERTESRAGGESEGMEGSDQQGESGDESPPGPPPNGQGSGTPSSSGGEGEPSESESESESESDDPASTRLNAAQRAMEAAEDKLREAEREGALADQEEAIRELEQARAELEEILRQMREEEIARMLELLDARITRMLSMQIVVNDATVQLDENAGETLTPRALAIESAQLSEREREIIQEADEALALLRDEGSAIAFPEAIQQIRVDLVETAKRLDASDVGLTTQTIEQDIVGALQELLDSLEQAKKDAESRKQESGESQEKEPVLIELIAELKLIRSMQIRVNERTDFYAALLEEDAANEPTIRNAVRELADREQRIYDILREIERAQNER